MALFNDMLTNRDARVAWSYGRHAVRGPLVMHVEEFVGTDKQVTWRYNHGVGEWQECEKLSYGGYALTAGSDYHFHAGGKTDAADTFFPSADPLPGYAYTSVRPPQGMAADGDPDKVFGIYKCLKLAHFNSEGRLVQASGAAVPDGSDPSDYYTWTASPARIIADAMRRAGAVKRFRVSSVAASSNSFTAPGHGLVNYDQVRFYTVGDLPGGLMRGVDYYIINAGVNMFQVSATFGGAPVDITSNATNIYVGCLRHRVNWSDWLHKHDWDATLIEWDADGGGPGAAIQIPRFEAHLFFMPPFRLAQIIDRVCEVSCADWQRAGGKLRFMTPEPRASIYTFDQAKIGEGTFKTRAVHRYQKYNRVRVDFRDHDATELQQAGEEGACEPVVVKRDGLVEAAGGEVREFQIDGGVMRRGQAERVGHYTARSLIDSDQEVEIEGAPSAYKTLPADVGSFAHPVPGWTDAKFKLMLKEEDDFTKLGYRLFGRLYAPGAYSDTDQTPAPRDLPADRPNPYLPPEQVTNLLLTEDGGFTTDGGWQAKIIVAFDFGNHPLQQFARVEYRKGIAGQWKLGGIAEKPSGSATAVVAIPGVEKGDYQVRVIPTTRFAAAPVDGATWDTIPVQSVAPAVQPSNGAYGYDSLLNLSVTWDPGEREEGVLAQGEEVPKYKVTCRSGSHSGSVKRGPVPVDTLTNLTASASWSQIGLISFPCSAAPTWDKDGTVGHIGSASEVGCAMLSQVIKNDCEIYFEAGSKFPPRRFDLVNYPSITTTTVYWETTNAGDVPTLHAGYTGVSLRPLPGNRYGIRITRRQAEFIGPSGQVIARSTDLPLEGEYCILVRFGQLDGEAQEAKHVTIKHAEPEIFVYTADMMDADGLTPGADTVYVQVVRVSNNPSAADSAPLEITCIP